MGAIIDRENTAIDRENISTSPSSVSPEGRRASAASADDATATEGEPSPPAQPWQQTQSWNPIEGQEETWADYCEVNREFARVVVENYSDGDVIWVQHYHLLLTPSYLARKLRNANIGARAHAPRHTRTHTNTYTHTRRSKRVAVRSRHSYRRHCPREGSPDSLGSLPSPHALFITTRRTQTARASLVAVLLSSMDNQFVLLTPFSSPPKPILAGLFMHQPFPSSEIFRCLTYREELLRGMLCADHIGFHLFEWARNFLASCAGGSYHAYEVRRGGGLTVSYHGRCHHVLSHGCRATYDPAVSQPFTIIPRRRDCRVKTPASRLHPTLIHRPSRGFERRAAQATCFRAPPSRCIIRAHVSCGCYSSASSPTHGRTITHDARPRSSL